MAVRLGDLNTKLDVYRPGWTKNAANEDVPNFSFVTSVWASIQALTAREQWLAQTVESTVSHRITIRHLDGLTTKYQLKQGLSPVYEIGGIRPIDGTFDELTCTEIQS